jgi:hypothetical protein
VVVAADAADTEVDAAATAVVAADAAAVVAGAVETAETAATAGKQLFSLEDSNPGGSPGLSLK